MEEPKKSLEISIQDIEEAVAKINKKLHKVENTSAKAADMSEGNGSRFGKLFTLHDEALANVNRQL